MKHASTGYESRNAGRFNCNDTLMFQTSISSQLKTRSKRVFRHCRATTSTRTESNEIHALIGNLKPRGDRLKTLSIKGFSAIIGIDWADRELELSALSPSDGNYEHRVISSPPETTHD